MAVPTGKPRCDHRAFLDSTTLAFPKNLATHATEMNLHRRNEGCPDAKDFQWIAEKKGGKRKAEYSYG
jgi:hypothetical protein